MNGVLDCREEQCPSLVTMAMSKNGNLSLVVLVAIVTLWVFMLATSLHVFCIAIKTTRKNAVAPASQGQEKQDEQQVQETAKKLYAGIKSKMAKVKNKTINQKGLKALWQVVLVDLIIDNFFFFSGKISLLHSV